MSVEMELHVSVLGPVMLVIGTAALAYLLGCVNGSILVSKYIFRDDIRTHGSGNAGLTNFYRTYGTKGVVGVLACDILKAMLAVIAAMFVSLGKQGDERRRMIVEKAGAGTLAVLAVYFLYCVGESLVRSIAWDLPAEGLNPLVTLTVTALVYTAHLLYFKKKYGG